MFITDDAKQSCEGKRIPPLSRLSTQINDRKETHQIHINYDTPQQPYQYHQRTQMQSLDYHGYDCPMNQCCFFPQPISLPTFIIFWIFCA